MKPKSRKSTKTRLPGQPVILLATLIVASTLPTPSLTQQGTCPPTLVGCVKCDENQQCTECMENRYLNITQRVPKCDPCPIECKTCGKPGCEGCEEGYFQYSIQAHSRISQLCKKCDSNCETCKGKSDLCLTCPNYFKLDGESHRCVFKYTNLIAVAFVVTVIFFIIIVFTAARCFCVEKPKPRVEQAETMGFGTILDKDPELRSDHYKTEVKTIGLNDDSCISDVKRMNQSYLNMSTLSKDKDFINQLLGPMSSNPELRSAKGGEGGDGGSRRPTDVRARYVMNTNAEYRMAPVEATAENDGEGYKRRAKTAINVSSGGSAK